MRTCRARDRASNIATADLIGLRAFELSGTSLVEASDSALTSLLREVAAYTGSSNARLSGIARVFHDQNRGDAHATPNEPSLRFPTPTQSLRVVCCGVSIIVLATPTATISVSRGRRSGGVCRKANP